MLLGMPIGSDALARALPQPQKPVEKPSEKKI
jgi:hypothetical protein